MDYPEFAHRADAHADAAGYSGDDGESASAEAIAIVGMTGRFPKARNLDEFWRNLAGGVECVSFFSADELRAAGVPDAYIDSPDYVPARAILDDADAFDAGFFGFTPREANATDPQQRVFLECAWEALEHAGYDPGRYDGLIGVYAGADVNMYSISNFSSGIDLPTLIGNDKDYLATRVAFKLNLKGPALTIQTACSTSLVAVQVACQGLLNYQCDMALAGGVGVAFPQKSGYLYQRGSILSPDGHCRAFDAQAGGTVGGDGAGVVVLKRLEDALADHDTIHAIIKGAAINNDGALKVGFTAPSVEGQAQVIAMAHALADVEPDSITYVETHGTGTELGDPIEIAALTEVFRASTDRTGFCAVGALKSNVGHMNSAAGIGGLIKTVLALKHRQIPPSLHFEKPNPIIDFEDSPFFVNAALRRWDAGKYPRRAGVSSFGIGGTNAHAVLEEAPEQSSVPSDRPCIVVVSAKTISALNAATSELADFLSDSPAVSLADVAYTLQTGRQLFEYRRMAVCRNRRQIIELLREPERMSSSSREPRSASVAFMFTGQGSQYVGMGRGLYEAEPVFREHLEYCLDYLRPHLGLDLCDLLYPPAGGEEKAAERISQTAVTQPLLFSIHYALARLWMSWGVQPAAMIGHSIGEYAAACLAGVLSLDDALTLVVERGALMQALPGGSMMAVPLPADEAGQFAGVSVAAVNAPAMSVLSGSDEAIAAVARELTERGVSYRNLHTSHAFHSEMMEPMLDDFIEAVGRVQLNPPAIPYVSNVTGTWVTDAEATNPAYWGRHCRQGVRFADGIATLMEDAERVFLEVGPGRSLTSLVKSHSTVGADRTVLTSMRHPKERGEDVDYLFTTLGELYLADIPIDWQGFHAHDLRRRVPAPTYPFERERYWRDPRVVPARDDSVSAHKRSDIGQWLYQPSWYRALPGTVSEGIDESATWLVLADDVALHRRIIAELRTRGLAVTVVTPGAGFSVRDQNLLQVDPRANTDYEQVLVHLSERGSWPDRIVHLWQLGTGRDHTDGNEDRFSAASGTGYYSILALAKALARALTRPELTRSVHLDVVADGLAEVTGTEPLCPDKAAILGPCRIVPQELEQVTCRVIDVVASGELDTTGAPEAGFPARLPERVIDELLAEPEAPLVALRGRYRWLRRFDPVVSTAGVSTRFTNQGVYLITGGLGGLGLTFANYLAGHHRARLILTGRTQLPAENEWDSWLQSHPSSDRLSYKIAQVRALRAAGSEVMLTCADVADRQAMQAVIANVLDRFGQLDGVIHAAGNLGPELFRSLQETDDRISESHFAPKVHGLYNLAEALPPEVGLRILFSSLSTILGGVAQIAYAAANHFADVFAAERNRVDGDSWLVINWDAWQPSAEAMLDNPVMPDWAQYAVAPSEGVEAFQRALSVAGAGQIIISGIDLSARLHNLVKPNLREDTPTDDARAPSGGQHARPALRNEYVAPGDELEAALAEIWQELLGIDRTGVHDSFFKLGGDSLSAIQLSSRVRDQFQVDLSVNSLFDEPTIAALANKIRDLQATQTASQAASLDEKLAMIEGLSDDEVLRMLAELKGGETNESA